MVFFNCNACGESLKKNQVEKHYTTKCRNCEVLSCVDCGKEFWGEAYQEHTKCISEEEKYSGKNFKPKANANKGEAKQEAWIEQVQAAIEKAKGNPRLRSLLVKLQDYPNIPRKKAKFENFVRNSLRERDSNLISQVWDVMEQEAKANKEAKEVKSNGEKTDPQPTNEKTEPEEAENGETEPAGDKKALNKRERKEERKKKQGKKDKKNKTEEETTDENDQKKKKKKKRKRDESDDEEENDDAENNVQVNGNHEKKKKSKRGKRKSVGDDDDEDDDEPAAKKKKSEDGESGRLNDTLVTESPGKAGKFLWEDIIISVLKKASDQELPVKKLRKKVLAAFYSHGGHETNKAEEKLLAKFDKKINKNPNLKVQKDRVKLIS